MMNDWLIALAIVGMGLITLLTRGFFMIPKNELPMPDWAKNGLRYAPLAALAAVIVPEIVMTQGELISTWQDARLYATAGRHRLFLLEARHPRHHRLRHGCDAGPAHRPRLVKPLGSRPG